MHSLKFLSQPSLSSPPTLSFQKKILKAEIQNLVSNSPAKKAQVFTARYLQFLRKMEGGAHQQLKVMSNLIYSPYFKMEG